MGEPKRFFENGIRPVKITDWLDWAAGNHADAWRIVLPMIQRGSVWKPHQVMDLWDTLLRGMPLGSMMASQAAQGMACFHPITRELEMLAEQGGLSLLDGQQRTLSMLLAWPAIGQRMNRRLWVDLGENDKSDHLFRLHFSTEQHPFGFQRAGQSGSAVNKLSRSDRRKALAAYADLLPSDSTGATTGTARQLFAHQDVRPWQGTLPIDLQCLIRLFHVGAETFKAGIQQQRLDLKNWLATQSKKYEGGLDERLRNDIASHFERQLQALNEMPQDDFDQRIERLLQALTRFSRQYMPVIEVPDHVFATGDDNDDQDPALAVLFQRVGTGGTALSNADYVFSVIKQRSPQCHALVEGLLKDEKIAALFTPVTLVTTAVRLTAAKLGLTDHRKIDKAQFARLLRGDAKSGNTGFLSEFEAQISPSGEFSRLLKTLIKSISYTGNGDIGLPKHALCLLDIPTLEVALRWLQTQTDAEVAMTDDNRKALIRFTLYGALAVIDLSKASELAFKALKELSLEGAGKVFPDRALIEMLVNEKQAYPICAPAYYRSTLENMIFTPDNEAGLRGGSRFVADTKNLSEAQIAPISQAIELYRRWWNRKNSYAHAMLLWLQRDYVHQKFESIPALPGMEGETPYDFDHICPQNHWYYWTGSTGENRLIDFRHQGDGNHGAESLLGNSIGNVRVWCSSDNRSDGESPPALKLRLKEQDEQSGALLTESAIAQPAADWRKCSFAHGREDQLRYWDASRAQAFQRAIEQRAFALYERFYTELAFAEL